MRRAPLAVAVAILAGGILAGLERPVPADGPLLVVVALAAVGALLLALPRRPAATGPGAPASTAAVRWSLALMALTGFALGSVRAEAADRGCGAWLPAGLRMGVRATVADRLDGRLRLRLDSVRIGGRAVECALDVGARWDGEGPAPGSRVVGVGRLWRPAGAHRPLGPPGLLLLDSLRVSTAGAVGAASDSAVGTAGTHAAGAAPGAMLARARAAAHRRVERLFPEHGALVASLLLARRDGLDRTVRERYARAGLSHLLAISGLHVGLVAGILLLTAGATRAGKGTAGVVAATGTGAYVLFLGAPDSAVRACLQIALVLAARGLQRPTRTESLVAAAALALLVADPGALVEPGFQLSFAGVIGILALRRPFLRALGSVSPAGDASARASGHESLRGVGRAGRWMADGLATSLAATLATAPIVAWHFGRVAPIGILANLVAIPLLGLAVPALALALGAGSVWPGAGRFVADGAAVLLDALDATAAAAAAVPGGSIPVTGAVALTLTAAGAGGWLATRRLGKARGSVRTLVWAGSAAAVLAVAPVRPVDDAVEVHAIDVGQGEAIAVRSPAGRWILVDAGIAAAGHDAGARIVVPYLARRGVVRLEALILTHPDADHTGGAASVMGALRPRWVGDPGVPAGKDGYAALVRLARERGVQWVALSRGVELEMDGMRMEVLYPRRAGPAVEDANDASVVLRVEYGEFAALLTGDAPASVEVALARRYGGRLDADLLKVGHHGSATSTTPDLLDATGATVAVISAGRGNRYGHPHRSVVERLERRGIRVLRTDRHGSIVVRGTADGRVGVATSRAGPVRPEGG